MKIICYVCGSESAKQCTGCHTISYCSKDCQKKDWPYHKHSCKSTSSNVIDSLINAQEHLVRKIFHHLSGLDLHHVRCVKHSWRDVIASMWQSKADRNLFEAKLAQQWKENKPRGGWLYEGHGLVPEYIKHNDQELFLAFRDRNEISALDMNNMYKVNNISRWQTKTKYTLKVENPSRLDLVWDVQKSFVMVWDGWRGLRCVDRETMKDMVIFDESEVLQVCFFLYFNFQLLILSKVVINIQNECPEKHTE